MKIHTPELIDHSYATVRVQSLVEFGGEKRVLWYELDKKYKDYLTLDRMDGFAVALICQAMEVNEDIVVDGPVSNKLMRNLKYYIHVMKTFYPEWHVIRVLPASRVPLKGGCRGPGIATGFSTGVDSFCTLYDHFLNGPNGNHINYLLNVNVGSHGHGEDGEQLFRNRLAHVREVADKLGLELIAIDSNLDNFYSASYEDTHGVRLMSAVLLLQGLLSTYFLASTLSYSVFAALGSTGLSDHLLSTEALEVVHDGAQYTRVEKTRRIADWPLTHAFLNVCTNDATGSRNCSTCVKCLRTMVTLDLLGLANRYKSVFDYSDWANKKDGFVTQMIQQEKTQRSYTWREIVVYAEKVNYPLLPGPGKRMLKLLRKVRIKLFGRPKDS